MKPFPMYQVTDAPRVRQVGSSGQHKEQGSHPSCVKLHFGSMVAHSPTILSRCVSRPRHASPSLCPTSGSLTRRCTTHARLRRQGGNGACPPPSVVDGRMNKYGPKSNVPNPDTPFTIGATIVLSVPTIGGYIGPTIGDRRPKMGHYRGFRHLGTRPPRAGPMVVRATGGPRSPLGPPSTQILL